MNGVCPICGESWDMHWPFPSNGDEAECVMLPPADWEPIAALAEQDRMLGGEG